MSTNIAKENGEFQIKVGIFQPLFFFNKLNQLTMKFLFSIIFCLFFSASAISQDKSIDFPDDFFGIYKGNLHISSEKGNQNIPMEFHLLATDSVGTYAYTLVYGEGETKQVCRYTLIEKSKEKGTYVVDENNGILMDTKVIDNKMYTLFEVQGNLLTTFITFESGYLDFEIIFSPTSKQTTTYTENEEKIEVISHPITTVQRAVLQKQ